jgi:AraC-like DNA-binding protein
MAPRKKTLDDLVRDRSWLARRHSHFLLTSPLVADPGLRSLQKRYRDEKSRLERHALALEFEKAVRDPLKRSLHALEPDEGDADVDENVPLTREELQAELDAIVNAPPEPYDPAKSRADSERFARALEARRLRSGGLTLTAIAREMGVSPSTVRRLLARLTGWQAAVRPPAETRG